MGSMFGDGNPKERIYDVLRELKDEGHSPENVAKMCAECLHNWLEWEIPSEDVN